MIREILRAIGLGRSALRWAGFPAEAQSRRARERASQETEIGNLEKRTGDLQALFPARERRLAQMERSRKDAVAQADAAARRTAALFWMSPAGCALGAAAWTPFIIARALGR